MKYLVGISIILSMVSWYTARIGLGELYPFFYYKLYSQPSASKGFDENLRVYTMQNTILTRKPMEDIHSFSKDDIMYSLSYHVQDTLQGKQKLAQLLHYLYPDQGPYWIYKETFSIKEILKNAERYDTILVAKIQ